MNATATATVPPPSTAPAVSAATIPAALPFTLQRISPAIGAEVSDIDLRQPLSDSTLLALRHALVEHKVLVFRDQDISPAQQVAFGRRFGELEVHPVLPRHPEHPELVMLGGNAQVPARENNYHSDVSWRATPSMASILRCQECPEVGGDTIWANMELAYEQLPAHRKAQIEHLQAVHDLMPTFGAGMTPEQQAQARLQFPPVAHPVVRTHPESGRKILYINATFVTHLANFAGTNYPHLRGTFELYDEQNDLLQYLYRQVQIPEYQMRLRWRPHTIAMWDNRSTQHYAVQDYFPAVRRMLRATVIGDAPR